MKCSTMPTAAGGRLHQAQQRCSFWTQRRLQAGRSRTSSGADACPHPTHAHLHGENGTVLTMLICWLQPVPGHPCTVLRSMPGTQPLSFCIRVDTTKRLSNLASLGHWFATGHASSEVHIHCPGAGPRAADSAHVGSACGRAAAERQHEGVQLRAEGATTIATTISCKDVPC